MKVRPVLIVCTLLLSLFAITGAARAQSATSLKFDVKVVDAITGKPKSTFILGETVSAVFSVTNVSGRARTIWVLNDTDIPWKLVSTAGNEEPEPFESGIGGSAGADTRSEGTSRTMGAARRTKLGPGLTVSMTTRDLRAQHAGRLNEPKRTLGATYSLGRKVAR